MSALYITSVETFSGKTAICLALGRQLQKGGYRVGYFKPMSFPPHDVSPGQVHDEDADFVRRTLGLEEPLSKLVGCSYTRGLVCDVQSECADSDILADIRASYAHVAADKDVVLLEGGVSLWAGVSVGLDPATMANALDTPSLVIVRFRDETRVEDDCVMAHLRLGERLVGVIINSVPEHAQEFVTNVARPYLEERGIPVMGTLPHRRELQAIGVGELAQTLGAEFLTFPEKESTLIEHLVVGAMSVAQALPRIRRVPGTKAVITGGDRVDMQLVALETTTDCLILTGHLRPSEEVLYRARERGVPVLLVRGNTFETVEAIERVFGKTRLGQTAKLERFEALVTECCDLDRLFHAIGIT